MHEERRAAQRVLAVRRNLFWPLLAVAVLGVIFGTVWAVSQPPSRGGRR